MGGIQGWYLRVELPKLPWIRQLPKLIKLLELPKSSKVPKLRRLKRDI